MPNQLPKNYFVPVKPTGKVSTQISTPGTPAPNLPAWIQGGKGATGGGLPHWLTGGAPKNPTLTQYIESQIAHNAKPTESFWGRIGHDAGSVASGIAHPVSWTFDKLLRPMYGTETALDQYIKGGNLHNVTHGFVQGIEGKSKMTGSQILSDAGLLHGHGILRAIAGLGIDVAADPLTYLSGGTDVLLHGAEHAAVVKAGDLAINADVTASKGALEGMKLATQQLKTAGDGYTARAAAAGLKTNLIQKMVKGKNITDKEWSQLGALEATASKEKYAVEKFLPQMKWRVPGTSTKIPLNPTTIAGKQAVPALPKLAKAAEMGGPHGAIAKAIYHRFIVPEGQTPALHALEIQHKHIFDTSVKAMMRDVTPAFKGVDKGILKNENQMLRVLHHFEVPEKGWKAVQKAGGEYVLNPKYVGHLLAHGKITDAEAQFAQAYHMAGQALATRDARWGVNYKNFGEQGRMYVPRSIKRETTSADMPTYSQTNRESEAGFQKVRVNPNYSLLNIKRMINNGEFDKNLKVLTNPMEALFARVNEGAGKQADSALTDALTKTLGVSTHVVDHGKLTDIRNQKKALVDQMIEHQAASHDAIGRFDQLNQAAGRYGEHINPNDYMDTAIHHESQIMNLQKEIAKLDKAEGTVLKGTPNPEFNPNKMSPTRSVDQYGHQLALPHDIAAAVTRYNRLISGEGKESEQLYKAMRKGINYWKGLVTTINPGYRVRYSLANFVAMWTKGMPAHAIPQYMAKAAKLIKDAKNGDKAAMDTMARIESAGGTFGIFRGDVAQGAQSISHGGTVAGELAAHRPDRALMNITQRFNIYVDNLDHISFMLWNKDQGKSWAEAIRQTKETLFDYTDLTPFERKTMKTYIPFYSWVRKNVPFQLKQFGENPGRESLFPKVAMESEGASNDKGNIIPDYIANDLQFGVPVFGPHTYYRTSAGVSDLRAFESLPGLKEMAMGELNPALKVPMEMLTNRNTFTGQPISDPATHAFAPSTPLGAEIANLIHPGWGSTTSRMGPNGQRVTGPGVNPYLQFLYQQVPWLNTALVRGPGSIKNAPGNVPWWSSEILGMSASKVDPAVQRTVAEINLANQAKAQIAKARDQGRVAPAKKPKKGALTSDIMNAYINSLASR